MANYKITDSELISIATAIREKAGISKQLIFPTEFVSEIENIPSGGGGTSKTYLCAGLSTHPCIDTGVPCNTENLKIVTTFRFGRLLNDRCIFGGTWGTNGFLLIIYNNTYRFHSKGQSLDIPVSVFNTEYNMLNDTTIECTKDYIKVKDNEYQITATGNNTNNNLKIFTTDSHNAAEIAFSSFKIYQDNVLLRDFIPALTDNDVACFYDNITKQYFYNSGADELYYRTDGGNAVVQPLSVTQNGTYNPPTGVDGYAPVTVNVSGGGGGGLNTFGLFSLITRRESSMSWQQTLSSLRSTWNGAGYIGADAFVGIDLTNVSSISIDVATGNSYSNTQAGWYIMLAIMATSPSQIHFPANDYQTNFETYDEFHERNSSTTLTIDVSNYTGLHHLIISAIGWNAEFTNLVIT